RPVSADLSRLYGMVQLVDKVDLLLSIAKERLPQVDPAESTHVVGTRRDLSRKLSSHRGCSVDQKRLDQGSGRLDLVLSMATLLDQVLPDQSRRTRYERCAHAGTATPDIQPFQRMASFHFTPKQRGWRDRGTRREDVGPRRDHVRLDPPIIRRA